MKILISDKSKKAVEVRLLFLGGDYMNCKYSVLIVAGALVLIPPADKPERYQDLINSLLLAQLAANKKLEKNPGIGWYDVYMEFLDKYWLRHFRARLDLSVAQGNSVSIVDWVVAPEFEDAVEQCGVANAVMRRLAALSSSEPAIGLLRGYMQKSASDESTDQSDVAMTVRLLAVEAHSPMSMSSVYIEFETGRLLADNPLAELFQAEDIRGSVCRRSASAKLSEALYGPVRSAIALKVQDRLEANVALLRLTEDVSAEENGAAD
ncbi:hypothetical protein [Pseudomonas koreensis]|uniref:hypothetical protein n=1 Tax=Pseudomonas koreensis TaxID=198620 RepID=UPI003209E44E